MSAQLAGFNYFNLTKNFVHAISVFRYKWIIQNQILGKITQFFEQCKQKYNDMKIEIVNVTVSAFLWLEIRLYKQ